MPRGGNNPQNLVIPTSEKARENGRKGGLASGAAQRQKKAMREAAQMVLSLKSPDHIKEQLRKMGIKDKDCINQTAILISLCQKALKGDIRAAEFLRDTAGENPNAAITQEEQETIRIIDDI